MRTTNHAARGIPLAVLLVSLMLLVVGSLASHASGISIVQSLNHHEIFLAGMGEEPDTAVLDLVLQGLGPLGRYPVDCILVIDTSATADLGNAKQFAFDLIERLSSIDRIGLVTFATSAQLVVPLTTNRVALRSAIGDLATGGKSAFGLGLQTARRELLDKGRNEALLVEILLTDGQNNAGIEPDVEGEVASDVGIMMVPVGIGTLINKNLMQGFASDTGGVFYSRPSDRALDGIIDHLTVDIVANSIEVVKRIPSELRLVNSSPSPSRIVREPNGDTSVIWTITEMGLGRTEQIEVVLEGAEKGEWVTDDGSFISYVDFRGVERTEDINGLAITVYMPNQMPVAAFGYEPIDPTTADSIEFTDASFDPDEDGELVAWAWDFGDGTTSELAEPTHRFSESGTYVVTLTVTDERGLESEPFDVEIVVSNAEPVAGFVVRDPDTLAELDEPRVGVEVMLDASLSFDLDGRVDTYLWDFDSDGLIDAESASPEISHVFPEPGEILVTLRVVDDEQGVGSLERTVDVLATVTAERSIETCLPVDTTIPGGFVKVTISLRANTLLNGLSVSETIPVGWTFQAEDNDGATLRINGQTLEWLFLERFADDGVNSYRQITYALIAPTPMLDGGIAQANVHGVIGSSSPRISQTILGDDKLTITDSLTVPVAISRWDTENQKVDLCLKEQIAFDQIQYAVSLWLSGSEVPLTNGKGIDLAMIQELIAYWLTGSSVHDPLP